MRPAITTTIAIAGLVGLSAIMAATTDFSKTPALVQPAMAQEADCRMSLEQFEQIRPDWAISRVNNLLGCVGDVTAESKFGDIETKVVVYPGDRGNFQLMFQNRRLVRKLKLS